MLLRLWISIIELKSALQDQIDGLYFRLKDVVKRLFIDFFDVSSLFGKNLIASEESFDGIDADGDEGLPSDVSRLILISQSKKHPDVIFGQIVGRQQFKRLIELKVA